MTMCSKTDTYKCYLLNYLKNTTKLALLLDYDGTLSPIATHPDLAKIPPETKAILDRLSQKPDVFVAIISGRRAENVKDLVGLQNITYAGNHGFEVIYPDGSKYSHELPSNYNDNVKELVEQLEKEVVKDGAWVENKGASLTFHFRAVPENLQGDIEKQARKIIEGADFKAGNAHCAIEARPKVDWNKGSIALLLLDKKYGDNWKNNVKVIFAGDDTTDEDAMNALKGFGATFRIAPNEDVITAAEQRVNSTGDIVEILNLIESRLKK